MPLASLFPFPLSQRRVDRLTVPGARPAQFGRRGLARVTAGFLAVGFGRLFGAAYSTFLHRIVATPPTRTATPHLCHATVFVCLRRAYVLTCVCYLVGQAGCQIANSCWEVCVPPEAAAEKKISRPGSRSMLPIGVLTNPNSCTALSTASRYVCSRCVVFNRCRSAPLPPGNVAVDLESFY